MNDRRRRLSALLIAALSLHAGRPATIARSDEPNPRKEKEPAPVTESSDRDRANRLIHAASPYLLQHARNPVDWHEWNAEALARARAEDKPIFLSIGYAACHWCHVMAHESFEDDEVAAVLNRDFISIKVDREERPDLDELYMAYTQALTGGGGWPMSVWLAPDGAPFYAGTYFPKNQFIQLLRQIAERWKSDRDAVTRGAEQSRKFFDQWAQSPRPAADVIPLDAVDRAASLLADHFDRRLGGISGGGTNKFPPSMAMDLLLRVHRRTADPRLLEAVDVTLDHMARGGILDHLAGGICRYSTDPEWLVPHFEKMLYDQALVSAIYLDGYLVTRNPRYAAVAADIFDYVLADLRAPGGAFYSSRDADSDGLEGKFYVWTLDEIINALGKEDGELCARYFDVTESGNWFERLGHAPPGPKNILHIPKPPALFAKAHNLELDALNESVKRWREKLLAVRATRTPPALDDKILADWNGLMIAGLARGARVLDQPRYARAAADAADFILADMQRDGRLLRSWRDGVARLPGTLADHAFLIEGLLNLYEADFNPKWLDHAERLADQTVKYFFDDKHGAFYYTASDAEKLIVRSKHPHDGAIPSANAVHAMNLFRLALLLDRKDLREKGESILRAFADEAARSPGAFERLLSAADFHHDQVREIALVGDPAAADTRALLRAVFDRYLPNKVVVLAPDKVTGGRIPLLSGKGRIDHRATAYVCRNYRCRLPVTSPDDLDRMLSDPR